ncbi:MAG TPA: Gfo/Idh/MocA family oxidoreductase [Acidimicrobiales bacterium]|nr:Gfo/Idh/MocA family oxidoreductase [Acidimicrobiales bacterium]
MSDPIRWGILGTGGIAHTFASDLSYIDDGVVAAIGSRSQSSADSFGDRFGVPRRYDSYEELVRDDQVDAVYVATPHPMHFENASLALGAGKPVLVEKAFTMTGQEARDLVALARHQGLFLMEAMWTRFLPHVIALRELISAGRLGEIVSFEADHGQWFALDPSFRLFAPELGGGALLDLGVYPVSFASMLLGTPERITALIEPAFTGVDGQVSMIFGYQSGAQSTLSCTSLARTATRACVSGTRARVEIAGDFYAPTSMALITRDGEREDFVFDTQGRGLHYEAHEVARCLREGRMESDSMPLDESIAIMETMDQILAF